MSKLTRESVVKLVSVRRTALYNATGCRHGSVHYRTSQSKNHQQGGIATLLWYAINVLPRRK